MPTTDRRHAPTMGSACGSCAMGQPAPYATFAAVMVAFWVLHVCCAASTAPLGHGLLHGDGTTRPSNSHYPFHAQFHDSASLRQLLNGSLLPSTSVVLLRVSAECRAPQSLPPANTEQTDENAEVDVEAARDVRRWMDDAYGCNAEWCWYALVDFCALAPPPSASTTGGAQQTRRWAMVEANAIVLAAMNVSVSQLQEGGPAWFILSPRGAPASQQPAPPKTFEEGKQSRKQSRGLSTPLKKKSLPSRGNDDDNIDAGAAMWRAWNETVRLPHMLRDVLHAMASIGALTGRTVPSEFDGVMSWKVVRGCQLASSIALPEDATPHAPVVVGRSAIGRGAPLHPLLAHSLRKLERLGAGGAFQRQRGARIASAVPFTEDPQGLLLVEARHVAALLYCNATSPRVRTSTFLTDAAHWRKKSIECWGGLHRRLRRHAVLHVLEHELTRRIPNEMVVLSPRLSTSAHRSAAASGASAATDGDTHIHSHSADPWHVAAEHAPLLSRTDNLEMLRASILKTGARLPSAGPIIDANAEGVAPMRPQRIAVVVLNASSAVLTSSDGFGGASRLDRHVYKLLALLAAPQYYGHVRAFYAMDGDAHGRAPAATRAMLQYLRHGEGGEESTPLSSTTSTTSIGADGGDDATAATAQPLLLSALPSMGHTLPLSKRYILDDTMMRTPPLLLGVSSLPDIAPALIDRIAPTLAERNHHDAAPVTTPGHDPTRRAGEDVAEPIATTLWGGSGNVGVAPHRERQAAILREFRERPLRRVDHVDQWMSHVVGHQRGIVAIALLPDRVTTLAHPYAETDNSAAGVVVGGYKWCEGIAADVARYFLPIRSTSLFVNVFSMRVPVLDHEGRVAARRVSDTLSASSFDDHAAQTLMRTAKVRRLPALMILYGDDGDGALDGAVVGNRTSTPSPSLQRRHLIAYGEFNPPSPRSKNKKTKQKATRADNQKDQADHVAAVKAFWSPRRLIVAIRNVSWASKHRAVPAVTAAGDAAPRRGAKYIGHVTNAKLRAMGIEASGSAALGGNRSGIAFLNPEGWDAPYDAERATEEALPVSIEQLRPWRVPSARRKLVGTQATPQARHTEPMPVAVGSNAADRHDGPTDDAVGLSGVAAGGPLTVKEKLMLLREPLHRPAAPVGALLDDAVQQLLVGWDALRSHCRARPAHSDRAAEGRSGAADEVMDMRD